MKQSIAAAPAETWNQKNLPSDIERFNENPNATSELLAQLPEAALGFARRNRNWLLLGLTAVSALGLAWYFSRKD